MKNALFASMTAGASLLAALAASAQDKPAPATMPAAAAKPMPRAVAVLHPASGSSVSGTIWFTDKGGSVELKIDLAGLTPGKHGFHVHELGDCSAPDATSAGGHHNPGGHPHAAMDAARRHMGDLGNVEAGADGKVSITLEDRTLKLHGEGSIVGRAVIVHANPDDLTTQPTGNAGGRVACGVIGHAK